MALMNEGMMNEGDVPDAEHRRVHLLTASCPGRGFDGSAAKAGCAAFLQDEGVGANGVGTADDGAQVMGILNSI